MTATAYLTGVDRLRATIYSDVGLTTLTRNPFPLVNGAYDFYADNVIPVYVAVGVDRPIYENSDDLKMSFADYQAPQAFPKPPYVATNVTTLRTGDFSALVAADVRSILGTLIQDLRELGVLK
jgi:hypothetical protein